MQVASIARDEIIERIISLCDTANNAPTTLDAENQVVKS